MSDYRCANCGCLVGPDRSYCKICGRDVAPAVAPFSTADRLRYIEQLRRNKDRYIAEGPGARNPLMDWIAKRGRK